MPWLLLLLVLPPSVTVSARRDQNVYALADLGKPGKRRIVIAGEAPGLIKLGLGVPLLAGRWELTIEGPRGPDHTVVFSLPVAGGAYTFVVTARARARYDFVLERPGGREYRAALLGPLERRVFEVVLK